MTELGKIVAICLVGILLALLLQKNNPELAILLALAVCAGALVFGLGHMKRVLAMLEQMARAGGLSSDLLQTGCIHFCWLDLHKSRHHWNSEKKKYNLSVYTHHDSPEYSMHLPSQRY